MIQKITIIILILVDVILCALCVWAFRANNNTMTDQQTEQIRKTEILENCFVYGLTNDNIILSEDLKVTDKEKQARLLKDIVNDDTKLIVRISESHCEDCIRFFIVKLLRLAQQKKWNENQVIVLASYQDQRSLTIFADRLGIRFPLYQIEDMPLPVEDIHVPYCFILERNLQVKHLFVPDKYDGRISNTYLDFIDKRYFSE